MLKHYSIKACFAPQLTFLSETPVCNYLWCFVLLFCGNGQYSEACSWMTDCNSRSPSRVSRDPRDLQDRQDSQGPRALMELVAQW